MKSFFTIWTWSLSIIAPLWTTTFAFADKLQVQAPTATTSTAGKAALVLEDIQGPVFIEAPINWWPYLATGLGSLALFTLIWWFVKKRQERVAPFSPSTVALSKIDDITGLQEQAPLLYVSQLSTITRQYIEQRFAISSSKTTRQFFHSIDASENLPLGYDKTFFTKFFGLFDTTKFAHRPPTPEEVLNIERAIRDFIQKGGDDALS